MPLVITDTFSVRSKEGLMEWLSDERNDIWDSRICDYIDTIINCCEQNNYDAFANLTLCEMLGVKRNLFEKFCRFINNDGEITEEKQKEWRTILLASMLLPAEADEIFNDEIIGVLAARANIKAILKRIATTFTVSLTVSPEDLNNIEKYFYNGGIDDILAEEIAVKNLLDKHHIDYKMFCIAYDDALKRIKNKDK